MEDKTKKCLYCAEDIKEDATKCKHCGSNLLLEEKNKKIKAKNHESYNTFTLLSFLLPCVGIVIGIIYLSKKNPLDKKLGEHAIASSILAFILWGVLFSFFIGNVEKQFISTQTTSTIMDDIYKKVSMDSVEQYRIAERQGDKIQICVQAGFVAAAYLQEQNESSYQEWKDIEQKDCAKAGLY
ncbi:MAG: hypothetical protein KAR54_02340 [Candidatus Pacebacteria bacterium]|nr:hypothetical protein [Candidatus Paceibacterota bacterium]